MCLLDASPRAGSDVPRPRSERTYDEHPWTPGPQCVCVTVRVACSERLSLSIRIAQGRNVLTLGKGSPFSYGKRFTCFAIASIGVVSVGPSVELSAFSAPQMDDQANIPSTNPVPTDPTLTDLMTPGALVFGFGATDLTRTAVGPKLRAAAGVSGPPLKIWDPRLK